MLSAAAGVSLFLVGSTLLGAAVVGMMGACELTEPISSRLNPPAPREPTTIMSASAAALRSSSTGSPVTAWTVTDGGLDSSSSLARTSSVSFWASS